MRITFSIVFCLALLSYSGSNDENLGRYGKYVINYIDGVSYVKDFRLDPCHSIAIPGFMKSVTDLAGGGLQFVDKNGVVSYVNVYPQKKKCLEQNLIKEVLIENSVLYNTGVDGSVKIRDPGVIDAELKIKLEAELRNKYIRNTSVSQGYPVKYLINQYGEFWEETDANYGVEEPYHVGSVDFGFEFFAATTFGLRAYKFNNRGKMASQFGDYDTSFYSVEVVGDRVIFSAPGKKTLFILDHQLGFLDKIHGYAVTAMRAHDGGVFLIAYDDFKNWHKSKLYFLNIETGALDLLSGLDIADSRGIDFHDGKIYVSEGRENRLVVFDSKNYKYTYWYGFRYPNGVTVVGEDRILVADEHAGVVREFDLQSRSQSFEFGFGVLASPSHVEKIEQGPAKGGWLIGDADNNRVLAIDPHSNIEYFKINNVRSVFDVKIRYQ